MFVFRLASGTGLTLAGMKRQMREIVAEKGITFEQFEEFKKRASSKLYSLMSVTGTGDFHLLPDGDRLYNAAMRVVGWPDPDTGELTLAPQAWVQRKIMEMNYKRCSLWEMLVREGVPVTPQNRETDPRSGEAVVVPRRRKRARGN